MAPIALGPKHQDLLKAYVEVSKTSGADWTAIATKADFPTSKYARDQWALVKSKLLATDNGTPINLADRQIALLKATVEVMKTEVWLHQASSAPLNAFLTDVAQTDWEKVASVANVKTSKYARDQFAIIRTKLCGGGKAKSDTATPTATPTKAKAGKTTQPRKRKKREGEASHIHWAINSRANRPQQQETMTMLSRPPPVPTRDPLRKRRRPGNLARSRSRRRKSTLKMTMSLSRRP